MSLGADTSMVQENEGVYSSMNVGRMGHGFQVIGIDARRIATKVIKYQTFGYRPFVHDVTDAMGSELLTLPPAHGELSVAVDLGTSPYPAVIRLIDVRPEPFNVTWGKLMVHVKCLSFMCQPSVL